MLKEYLNTLANAFRSMLETNEKINAKSFPEKIIEVYNKGVEVGKSQGGNTEEAYNNGFEAGKQAEYDRFWDVFQDQAEYHGDYTYAFSYNRFNDLTYNPKNDIVVAGSNKGHYMFFKNKLITDTKVTIDVSACTAFSYAFEDWQNGETIRKLIVSENITSYFRLFNYCKKLKNIVIEGVIGADISFSASPLSYDSIMSIIEHLKDYSGTNITRTLSLGDNNLAKLTDAEKAIATQKGWTLA